MNIGTITNSKSTEVKRGDMVNVLPGIVVPDVAGEPLPSGIYRVSCVGKFSCVLNKLVFPKQVLWLVKMDDPPISSEELHGGKRARYFDVYSDQEITIDGHQPAVE